MKKVVTLLMALAFCASAAFAQDNDDSVVRWRSIAGVMAGLNTAPPNGLGNPVGDLLSGNFPWSIRSGQARVNLSTGRTSFEIEGLVINGSMFSGTPGPVTAVNGTLVCNAGERTQANLDTTAVSLNAHGDAHFSGYIQNIPASCGNPLFLVRVATVAFPAAGREVNRWIATGIERFIGDDGQ